MIVSVIGAGGHVGLPFSLVVSNAGHKVWGIDVNEDVVAQLNKGVVPYVEHGAEELLKKQLDCNGIFFTTNASYIKESDVVAIMLGTPVDEENNPRLDALFDFVDNTLIPFMKKGVLIILRSTVSPGTTEVLKDRISTNTGWIESKDYYLVFCPERVLQTKGIEETANLPQLVGAFSDRSFDKAADFFQSFVTSNILQLSPREAEVAKLVTNMYRYVTFAFANEMWMIGEKQGIDIHKVINAANLKYGRMAMPLPGPNVGGPCLFKDGRFLLPDVPFVDLIQTSFIINEGMPDYIWNSICKFQRPRKVLILGATFKANCDDTRNSLSYKMVKVCKKHGAEVHLFDPYLLQEEWPEDLAHYDAVIVMTPHDEFKWFKLDKFNGATVIADVWKHFEFSSKSKTGIYRAGDIR